MDPAPGRRGDLEYPGRGGKACKLEPQTDPLRRHGFTVPTPPIPCTTAGLPRPTAMRAMSSAAVPIAPGEQELEVSVSVTYALE